MIRQIFAVVLLGLVTYAAFTISTSQPEPLYDEWGRMSLRPQAESIRSFNQNAGYVIGAQKFTEDFRANVPADSAVVIADLNSSLTIGYGAQTPLVSASLYKLFAATYTYKAIEAGDISFQTRTDEGRVGACLDAMITVSDNPCSLALGELLGWEEMDKSILADGYTGTSINNYDEDGDLEGDKITTAGDVALLLKRLYEGELLSASNTAEFLRLLSEQTIKDRQPDILPAGVEFWHKTGNLLESAHDAGYIVKKDQVYIYVIMTDKWEENAFLESQQYFQPFFEGVIDIFEL